MILCKDPFGIAPIIEPVIVGMGYNFWGLECQTGASNAQVRVYIDSSAGVTLDDCSRVSQQLSAVLDVEDPIEVPYTLEISSPGINRPLFSVEQMKRAVGDKVKVKTLWPIGERRNFKGILKNVGEEEIKIETDSDEIFTVPLDAIKNAKLDLDIEFNN
ncbi:MAG: ribosome maturation factor RimP [Gammaproteobacteria bacterium]